MHCGRLATMTLGAGSRVPVSAQFSQSF
jgi:hypothetical protein